MNQDEKLQAWEMRKTAYANQWKVGLPSTCCADPGCWCLALCCSQCVSYSLRKRALYNDMNGYLCCAGFFPCSGRCGESSCPEFCLCLEVCCCFSTSVVATRWMIQDELRIQNSKCDNCILGTMICLQQLACICQIVACIMQDDTLNQLADLISFIADVVWCTVCACMQTQHKLQLDERDLNQGATGGVVQQPPVPQPQMYQNAPMGYPAPGGYTPQGGYYATQGDTYGGAPQYPPPGYPPVQSPQQMYR